MRIINLPARARTNKIATTQQANAFRRATILILTTGDRI